LESARWNKGPARVRGRGRSCGKKTRVKKRRIPEEPRYLAKKERGLVLVHCIGVMNKVNVQGGPCGEGRETKLNNKTWTKLPTEPKFTEAEGCRGLLAKVNGGKKTTVATVGEGKKNGNSAGGVNTTSFQGTARSVKRGLSSKDQGKKRSSGAGKNSGVGGERKRGKSEKENKSNGGEAGLLDQEKIGGLTIF